MPDLLNGMAVLEAWHQEDPFSRFYAVDRARSVVPLPARSIWLVTLDLPHLDRIFRGRGDTLPEAVQMAFDAYRGIEAGVPPRELRGAGG